MGDEKYSDIKDKLDNPDNFLIKDKKDEDDYESFIDLNSDLYKKDGSSRNKISGSESKYSQYSSKHKNGSSSKVGSTFGSNNDSNRSSNLGSTSNNSNDRSSKVDSKRVFEYDFNKKDLPLRRVKGNITDM